MLEGLLDKEVMINLHKPIMLEEETGVVPIFQVYGTYKGIAGNYTILVTESDEGGKWTEYIQTKNINTINYNERFI